MSEHFHRAEDLKNLRELKSLAPTEFGAWLGLEKTVGRDDGAIPVKYRELIAIAVALATQCPWCLEGHAKAAKKAGATREEIAEVTFLASALKAGAAATHGAMTLRLFDEAE